ncbi:hypothetical protein NFI96_022343, partial [Prochilodus magdalenae]
CMGTSTNLVSTLFPKLIYAMKKNKPTMAGQYLEKARKWITDIIQDVDKTVQRYEEHNRNVSATTSDIIKEKWKTEEKTSKLSTEIKAMEDALEKLKQELQAISTKVTKTENLISSKSRELEDLVNKITKANKGLRIFAAVVPFILSIVQFICDAATGRGIAKTIRTLENQLNQLYSEKTFLKQQEWTLQLKVIEDGMKLAQKKIDHGAIPAPVHLSEVQRSLTQVQNILIQLRSFWEKVLAMLEAIKDKTFIDVDFDDDTDEKYMFVSSIKEASKVWKTFGHFCREANQIFREQSKDAYKFLEKDPSSFSKEKWQLEYDSVRKQLKNVNRLPAICNE